MTITVEAKERPILFSAPMVRAILEGRKSQTRRAMKPQPERRADGWHVATKPRSGYGSESVMRDFLPVYCPYGKEGDRLWVRETWATVASLDQVSAAACYQYDRPLAIYYAADTGAYLHSPKRGRWRPSIHMPRWASRLTLEIAAVRVERLHDISEDDIRAEGFERVRYRGYTSRTIDDPEDFSDIWDAINVARGYSWENNPWVWAITFRRI